MSYVQSVLQPGETVRHFSKIHWMVYLPGAVLLAIAVAVFVLAQNPNVNRGVFNVLGLMLLAIACVMLFIAWFKRWTTEIAVTDRRIIYKRGFIWRHTIEMHLDKVESVDVNQSILGRIFNYGDITIRGVGVGIEPLKSIEGPIAFRNHVTAE